MRWRVLCVGLFVATLLVWLPAAVPAQTLSVQPVDGQLRIRASNFSFLTGEPLAQLKDGRAVRVELTLTVVPSPGATAIATARRIFGLSYDLWEERFAVSTVESRPRTISHLTVEAAEAWCLEQTVIPLSALDRLPGDGSFHVRLAYRVVDAERAEDDDGSAFTLQGLIEALSGRRRTDAAENAIVGGPFRLPGRGGGPLTRR